MYHPPRLLLDLEEVDPRDRRFAMNDLEFRQASGAVRRLVEPWLALQESPRDMARNDVPNEALLETIDAIWGEMQKRLHVKEVGPNRWQEYISGTPIDMAVLAQTRNFVHALLDLRTLRRDLALLQESPGYEPQSALFAHGQYGLSFPHPEAQYALQVGKGITGAYEALNRHYTPQQETIRNYGLDFRGTLNTLLCRGDSRIVEFRSNDQALKRQSIHPMQYTVYYPNADGFQGSRHYPLTFHPGAEEALRMDLQKQSGSEHIVLPAPPKKIAGH